MNTYWKKPYTKKKKKHTNNMAQQLVAELRADPVLRTRQDAWVSEQLTLLRNQMMEIRRRKMDSLNNSDNDTPYEDNDGDDIGDEASSTLTSSNSETSDAALTPPKVPACPDGQSLSQSFSLPSNSHSRVKNSDS